MNTDERCELCRHWKPGLQDNRGYCLRHPPVVLHKRGTDRHEFMRPETHGRDWCGEFSK